MNTMKKIVLFALLTLAGYIGANAQVPDIVVSIKQVCTR